jgi:dsDNA-specific endonuclease/ATPase MutS2
MDIQDKLHKEMERLAKNQQDLQVTNDRLLKDKEEEVKRAREEMDQMRKNVEERDRKHAGEVAKLQEANKTVEETMKLEIAKSREKFEMDLQAYQEELVGGAVTLVREMDSYYQNLSAQQRQNMEEQIAKMKANAGPPPPYSASQYQQPIYVRQGPSADEMFAVSMKQAATAGAIGAGGLLTAAATAAACIVM